MRWLWLGLLLTGCGAVARGAQPVAACHVPSAARLGAIHFFSPEVGIGLTASEIHCESRLRRQPVQLVLTRDGGRSWRAEGKALPQPPAGIFVEHLAATSPRRVWASSGVGPLWATTDGGNNWTVQPVPGPVVALTITRKTLWALGCPHLNNERCRPVLARERLADGRWERAKLPKLVAIPGVEMAVPAPGTVIVEAGQFTQARLAITDDGGRRWRTSQPRWTRRPCDVFGLAAADRSDWWILCIGGAAAGSSTKGLLHTTNGGRTWTIASQVTSLTVPPKPGSLSTGEPDALAAGSRARLWLAFQNSMAESADAGKSWTRVPGVNPQGWPGAFDVLSPTRAWLLAAGQGLWRTTDGRRWREL